MAITWVDGGAPALSAANLNSMVADDQTALYKEVAVNTQTASYTLTATDKVVLFNGTSLTATLPDPTTVANRKYVIKNINASPLTIVSAGTTKTIDGAASLVIPQYLVLTVVSNGTAWFILSGGEVLPSPVSGAVILGPATGSNPPLTINTSNSNGGTAPTLHLRNNLIANGFSNVNPMLKIEEGYSGGNFIEHWTDSGKVFQIDRNQVLGWPSRNYTIALATNGASIEGNHTYQNGLLMTSGAFGGLWYKSDNTNSSTGWHPVGQSSPQVVKTANYTITGGDQITIGNGSSITITLPDPTTTIHKNRIFIIKNINATALTLVSAGTSKTIDGAASQSLAQWAKMSVVCDGTQWFSI